MKQMNVGEGLKVAVNYNNPALPPHVHELQPLVYREGNGYNCLLGPDLRTGILGYGATPVEALQNWNQELQSRLEAVDDSDEVILYVKDMLSMDKDDVW